MDAREGASGSAERARLIAHIIRHHDRQKARCQVVMRLSTAALVGVFGGSMSAPIPTVSTTELAGLLPAEELRAVARKLGINGVSGSVTNEVEPC